MIIGILTINHDQVIIEKTFKRTNIIKTKGKNIVTWQNNTVKLKNNVLNKKNKSLKKQNIP